MGGSLPPMRFFEKKEESVSRIHNGLWRRVVSILKSKYLMLFYKLSESSEVNYFLLELESKNFFRKKLRAIFYINILIDYNCQAWVMRGQVEVTVWGPFGEIQRDIYIEGPELLPLYLKFLSTCFSDLINLYD